MTVLSTVLITATSSVISGGIGLWMGNVFLRMKSHKIQYTFTNGTSKIETTTYTANKTRFFEEIEDTLDKARRYQFEVDSQISIKKIHKCEKE
jgi:hypothetical protein